MKIPLLCITFIFVGLFQSETVANKQDSTLLNEIDYNFVDKTAGPTHIATCSVASHTKYDEMPITTQISSFVSSIFDTDDFPARWHCGAWSTFHGWLYIISDLLIGLCYFIIPAILLFSIRKRVQSREYNKLIIYFILFILFCGVTHFIDALIFWVPVYKLNALLLFATALISVMTTYLLAINIPKLLQYRSPAETEVILNKLTTANASLKEEIALRKNAEQLAKGLNEDLEKKVVELEAFSYSVSHDLRSPLRAVHGFSEALMEDYHTQLDDEGKDFLLRINKGAVRMGHLIDDLLELSEISSASVNAQEEDLSLLVEQIVAYITENELPADHSYTFNIDPGLKASCDKGLLQIVFENLIRNAVKFSAKVAHPVIRFGQDMTMEGQPFFIEDNGVGFDMKFSEKLFQTFRRLHEADDFTGTGIGLSIVERVITKHSGRVWAQSEPNKGATFYFTLHKKS